MARPSPYSRPSRASCRRPSTTATSRSCTFAPAPSRARSSSGILIAQASTTGTNYTLIEDYDYNGTAEVLTATMVRTLPAAGPPRGRTVLVTDAPGTPHVAVTFGTNGMAACILGPC